MKLNKAGLDFLVSLEGLKLGPYLDTQGVPTIGIGSTYYEDGRAVKMTDKPITKDEVYHLFELTKSKYEKPINDVIKVELNQNKFNALFAFCYNVGQNGCRNSDLFKSINVKASKSEIEQGFMNWKGLKLNKKGLPELQERRQKEINLYFKPI